LSLNGNWTTESGGNNLASKWSGVGLDVFYINKVVLFADKIAGFLPDNRGKYVGSR
jgi:hypothetical protein